MNNVISHTTPARTDERASAYSLNKLSLGMVMIALLGFTAFAFAAHTTPYFDFDLRIARAVQSIHAAWFDLLMRAVGLPGYPPQVYVLVLIGLIILWFAGARWQAVSFFFAAVVISAFCQGIKLLVARPRPSPDLIAVANPALDGGSLSFPAGHTQTFTTILGFMIYLLLNIRHRAWWQNALLILFSVMLAFIGVSRIYSGEHWFSDVVAGYWIGAIGLWVTIQFYEWGKSKFFRARNSHKALASEGAQHAR